MKIIFLKLPLDCAAIIPIYSQNPPMKIIFLKLLLDYSQNPPMKIGVRVRV
jgi:hypothetical protein